MRPTTVPGLAGLPTGGRRGLCLVMLALGVLAVGCAREKHQITPTTLGTDPTQRPRGQMVPFPWPGQDISRAEPRPSGPTADPEAALASGVQPSER